MRDDVTDTADERTDRHRPALEDADPPRRSAAPIERIRRRMLRPRVTGRFALVRPLSGFPPGRALHPP